MLSSIELWARYVWHVVVSISKGRSPQRIADEDTLARQLFSGHVKRNGKLEAAAFVATASNNFAISLDRWSCAPERLFLNLGKIAGKKRSPQTFKGFALFQAGGLKSVRVKDLPNLHAIAASTKLNPFHADVVIPPGREKSFYLLVSTELRDHLKPKVKLYP